MNGWQFFQQLRYLLQAATWTGGNKVFGAKAVVVSADMPEDFLSRVRLPCALIRVQDAPSDPEHDEEPDLFMQSFDITVAVANANDPFGESAFLGAGRVTANDSGGRGLLEIEEQLWATVKGLGESSGVRIQSRGKGAGAGTPGSEKYIAWRTYRFEAELGSVRFYHPPTSLAAAAAGGGVVNLTWKLPPTRFDTFGLVLRRASGTTAPATVAGGSNVTLSSMTAVSKSDTPGAGTWSYSLFASYDEVASGAAAQYSAPISKTVVAT